MTVEEASELARRSIYHATFRDGASGGVASGQQSQMCLPNFQDTLNFLAQNIIIILVSCHMINQCTTWVLMDGRNCQEMMLGSYTITTTQCHQPLRNRSWRKQPLSKEIRFTSKSVPLFYVCLLQQILSFLQLKLWYSLYKIETPFLQIHFLLTLFKQLFFNSSPCVLKYEIICDYFACS